MGAQVVNRSDHPLFFPERKYVNEERAVGHRLAPQLRLYVHKPGSKSPFSQELLRDHFLELEFEEDVKMASQLKLTLSNPEYIVSDSDVLKEGNFLDVEMGYSFAVYFGGRRVEVVKIEPDFPRDTMPQIVVKGRDGRHRMSLGKKIPKFISGTAAKKFKQVSRKFSRKRDDQIVSQLASEVYGFAVDVDRTEGRKTRVKKKETSDWEFILRLAKLNNYETWVDYETGNDRGLVGWVLHFRKKELKPAEYYIFEYQQGEEGTLLEISLEMETTRQVTDVEVLSYERRIRKIKTAELKETKEVVVKSVRGLKGGQAVEAVDYGAKVLFTAFGRTMEVISHRPFRSSKDAKKYAENWLRDREEDFVTATGTVIGVENLKPRQVHKLTGLGVRFSGFYYFDQVGHKYAKDGSYECGFVAHRVVPELAQVHREVKAATIDYDD